MVLRNRERKMASEQPVKKKLRITDDEENRDETDFINTTDLSCLRTEVTLDSGNKNPQQNDAAHQDEPIFMSPLHRTLSSDLSNDHPSLQRDPTFSNPNLIPLHRTLPSNPQIPVLNFPPRHKTVTDQNCHFSLQRNDPIFTTHFRVQDSQNGCHSLHRDLPNITTTSSFSQLHRTLPQDPQITGVVHKTVADQNGCHFSPIHQTLPRDAQITPQMDVLHKTNTDKNGCHVTTPTNFSLTSALEITTSNDSTPCKIITDHNSQMSLQRGPFTTLPLMDRSHDAQITTSNDLSRTITDRNSQMLLDPFTTLPDVLHTKIDDQNESHVTTPTPTSFSTLNVALETITPNDLTGTITDCNSQMLRDPFTTPSILRTQPPVFADSEHLKHFPDQNRAHLSLQRAFSVTHNVPKQVNVPPPTLELQDHLVRQCLCGVPESTLRKPFENDGTPTLSNWPAPKTLQFLSNLQLLFDVYLKQNNTGHICSRICDVCDFIVRNEQNLVDQILELGQIRNKYVNYLAARVLASFLIVAKTNINNEWLEVIVGYLSTEPVDYVRMNFSLEVIKRVVDWKDVDIHILEESDLNSASTSHQVQEVMSVSTCSTLTFTDHESFDTSGIKGLIIKGLESKWPNLIRNIQLLIAQGTSQNCVLTFLALWESIISVRANLSVVDTKPFYAYLEHFVMLLNHSLPPLIWRQLLSLFNEVLCYGSTLALQDMLPEETCTLAHFIVRYVKDLRLLDSLPYRRPAGQTVNSFIGTISSNDPTQPATDKTLLQKMVLLVLKSVAITVKETRCDSSDSSVGSDDYDFYQDMQLIERSIRDVLKKVDAFIKHSLEFHPEATFSKILIQLFSDQDDYMIESMVCTLDITVGISYRNSVFPDLIAMLNPSFTFVEFLKIVSYDSDVLLDYLVSNETCFLLYLLRFLKYIRRNWSSFVVSCESSSGTNGPRTSNELDETMTVLIRLRHQISRLVNKQLFPYNINPVLRLLEMCESLYEGNELS